MEKLPQCETVLIRKRVNRWLLTFWFTTCIISDNGSLNSRDLRLHAARPIGYFSDPFQAPFCLEKPNSCSGKCARANWRKSGHVGTLRSLVMRHAAWCYTTQHQVAWLFEFQLNGPETPFSSHISNSLLESSQDFFTKQSKMASTSSSTKFTTLVTLHHHDFRVERLHMWWDFFNTVEQVGIKKDLDRATSLLTMLVNWDLLQAFTSF